jgi:hypothetical protein
MIEPPVLRIIWLLILWLLLMITLQPAENFTRVALCPKRTPSASVHSEQNKEGPGARAFLWGLSWDKYGAAARVCPKRHAKLSATIIKPQKSRKVAQMVGRQEAPGPVPADGALILLRLQDDGIVGCRAASNGPSAGHSFTSDLKPIIEPVATFVPQPSSNGGTR